MTPKSKSCSRRWGEYFNEVLALVLALDPNKFVAGSLVSVVACNLIDSYIYLVLAKSKMNNPIGLAQVLFTRDKQDYTDSMLRLRALCSTGSVQHRCSRPTCL